MKAQLAKSAPRRLRSHIVPAGLLALLALAGCGGSTTFQDTTPIQISQAEPEVEAPPPAPEKSVTVRDNSVALDDSILFAYNGAKVLEDAFTTLEGIAQTLKDNPHVKKVRIEGHASEEGTAAHNQRLSSLRAKAIRLYLIARGVSGRRLSTKGFGETQPVADNDTESGREQNRRVEFNILSQDVTRTKVELDPSTGEERVLETLSGE